MHQQGANLENSFKASINARIFFRSQFVLTLSFCSLMRAMRAYVFVFLLDLCELPQVNLRSFLQIMILFSDPLGILSSGLTIL